MMLSRIGRVGLAAGSSARSVSRMMVTKRFFGLSTSRLETFQVQNEEDFKSRVLESKVPVVVDFSASWCGPCKLLTPRLEAAVAATQGKVNLAIVDIDEHGDLAMDFQVSSVPFVVGIKDGEPVDSFVGLIDEDQLGSFVKRIQE